jgi:hypothetical protein
MPDVIGRVHRPRLGLNGARPIAERWTEAIDELRRVAPGVPYGQPISEMNLDHLHDLIEAHRKVSAPPPPDPRMREAIDEIYAIKVEFNRCALEIKQAQNWLGYARTDWRHRILGLHPDIFTPPPGLYPTGEANRFADAFEARAAVKELHKRLSWIRGICSLISSARAFENQPAGEQSIRLMEAFVARKLEADRRIEALEAHCMAIGRLCTGIGGRGKRYMKPLSAEILLIFQCGPIGTLCRIRR